MTAGYSAYLLDYTRTHALSGGSREAASIITGATSAVPKSENTYRFRLVSSGIEQDLQRERDLYEFKVHRASSGQPLMTAEPDFTVCGGPTEYR